MEPFSILFGAALTVATATALGSILLGRTCQHYAVRFVCGSALLSLAVFLLCWVHLAYPVAFLVLAAVAIGAAAFIGHRTRTEGRKGPLGRPLPVALKYVFGLLFAAYFIIYFINAMAPEVSPDGTAYHLSLVAQFFRARGFQAINWNLYASLSEGAEMLYLFAFAFGRHSAAAVTHFAFLIALAWQIVSYARRSGFPVAGLCAALLVFASPIAGWDAVTSYNDVALAAVAFTLFNVLELWDETRAPRLLVAIGILAGFCYAVKYTGWAAVLYAAGFILWKSRSFLRAAVVAACAAPFPAAWMTKNWLWVGNPLAPFFNQYFPNPNVTVLFEKEYTRYFRLYDLTSPWQIPWAVTVSAKLQGLIGPVFLLAPLGLIALRWKAGRHLLLAALVFGVSYFGNVGTRFLIPALPFMALALAMALATVPSVAVAVAVVHAVLSWPAVIPRYALPGSMHLTKVPWREALRIRDTNHFMKSHLPGYGAMQLIESRTPPGATVFSFSPVPEAYTSRRILVFYESAWNENLGRILRGAFAPGLQPTWRLRFAFTERALKRIRVVQTASGRDIWSIHELRVFDGGRELPRERRWRLTADPFPWTIQDAFDNSPLTLWRTGESIKPGMFVAVDFGQPENADAVLIETSPDQNQIRLKLEGEQAGGSWETLSPAPAISDAALPLGLRRAAARELAHRGIGYVLISNSEFGADDFRDNQDLWGFQLIGEADGMRLYQFP